MTIEETTTTDVLGVFAARLTVADLEPGSVVEFAVRTGTSWEGRNHRVIVFGGSR